MKTSVFILTLLSCALVANAQTGTQSQAMPPQEASESRLQKLEDDLSGLKLVVDAQKSELNANFQVLNSESKWQFWGIMGAIAFAIGSGPVTALVRSRYDKKNLQETAANIALEQMKTEFPVVAAQQIKAYLDKEIPARVEALINVSKDRENVDILRLTTKILVVAEEESIAKARAEFLRAKGYGHVATSLPVPYDRFPTHDICLIDHFEQAEDYEKMSYKYFQTLFESYSENANQGIFFCYPGRNDRLDFKLIKQKNFANSESQLDANLLRLIHQIKDSTPNNTPKK